MIDGLLVSHDEYYHHDSVAELGFRCRGKEVLGAPQTEEMYCWRPITFCVNFNPAQVLGVEAQKFLGAPQTYLFL